MEKNRICCGVDFEISHKFSAVLHKKLQMSMTTSQHRSKIDLCLFFICTSADTPLCLSHLNISFLMINFTHSSGNKSIGKRYADFVKLIRFFSFCVLQIVMAGNGIIPIGVVLSSKVTVTG